MTIAMLLAWVGTLCWGVCFWWMHRLSSRQEMMLKELHDMTKRIEKLSKAEHELIHAIPRLTAAIVHADPLHAQHLRPERGRGIAEAGHAQVVD